MFFLVHIFLLGLAFLVVVVAFTSVNLKLKIFLTTNSFNCQILIAWKIQKKINNLEVLKDKAEN